MPGATSSRFPRRAAAGPSFFVAHWPKGSASASADWVARTIADALLVDRPSKNRGGPEGERRMATRGYEGYEKGEGWLFFAFVILVIVGFFNAVLGITMIAGDGIYVTARDSGTVVIGDVNGWGWIILILGVLEVLAGFGVLARSQLSRWFGIVMATLAALGHLPVIFGPKPVFSFLVVLMSVLVIYGLAQYGGRERAAV